MNRYWLTIGMAVLIGAATATVSFASPCIQAAATLGRMHSDMMEAIEEGLAYLVMKEAGEKQDFEKKIATFDGLSAKFLREAGLNEPDAAQQKQQFNAVMRKRTALVQAFHTAFNKMETGDARAFESFDALEDAIDDFTDAFGPFSEKYFEQTGAALEEPSHEKAVLMLFEMHHDILECIEEAFGYLLLGDDEEADDFFDKLKDFREQSEAFSAAAYLSKPENAAKRTLFDDMICKTDCMETAARKMFTAYRSRGVIPMNEVADFEGAVDALTETYEKLLNEMMQTI